MLTSLALIFLVGLAMAAACQAIRLPRIIGMLLAGILLGPCVLGLLDESILSISHDLRQLALIIILLKAGLSLELSDLRRVGRPAVLLSFAPACFEIFAYALLAPLLLGLERREALLMGAVLAAVSPAVVVPRMVHLIETGRGTGKGIPQMILAGASCDDVFVIAAFSAFLGMAQGAERIRIRDFVNIPVSIGLGVVLGAVCGLLVARFFEAACARGRCIRNSMKVILILGISFLMIALSERLKGTVSVSGLLAVMSMACALKKVAPAPVSGRLSEKFGKLWLAAEPILFVLVGAAVDIRYMVHAGPAAAALIFLALLIRAIGVFLCLLGTDLTRRERIFCVIAYLPKATVQAAIGSVPLSVGLACGQLVLSTAVLAILLTAPLGAAGIDLTAARLLGPARPQPAPHRGDSTA